MMNIRNRVCSRFLLLCVYRVDVAHLSLYNLSVIHKKKYFDSELELMAFINENWDRLQLGEVRLVSSRLVRPDLISRRT